MYLANNAPCGTTRMRLLSEVLRSAMVDVEVDRYIDEISAFGMKTLRSYDRNCSPFKIQAPSIKDFDEPRSYESRGDRHRRPCAELAAAVRANRTLPRGNADAARLEMKTRDYPHLSLSSASRTSRTRNPQTSLFSKGQPENS